MNAPNKPSLPATIAVVLSLSTAGYQFNKAEMAEMQSTTKAAIAELRAKQLSLDYKDLQIKAAELEKNIAAKQIEFLDIQTKIKQPLTTASNTEEPSQKFANSATKLEIKIANETFNLSAKPVVYIQVQTDDLLGTFCITPTKAEVG